MDRTWIGSNCFAHNINSTFEEEEEEVVVEEEEEEERIGQALAS